MAEACSAEAATATIEMDSVKIVEDEEDQLPQKKHYRQRAHSNPHSDHDLQYPTFPAEADWSEHFGEYANGREVTFADVGCGYGGLLVRLAPMFPDDLMVGIEIRVKVSDYVIERIKALRAQSDKGKITAGGESGYKNVACIRSNAMKYLPNFFRKAQLKKMFILFPDPHFKKQKHKWRIVSAGLLAEYAYVIRPGGKLYTITDVEDLHIWMVRHLEAHPLFRRLTQAELDADPVVGMLYESTEEGQKVTRMEGKKFPAVFERIPDPDWH